MKEKIFKASLNFILLTILILCFSQNAFAQRLFGVSNSDIVELNPANGSILKHIPAPAPVVSTNDMRDPNGLAFDGTNLFWTNAFSTDKIFVINPSTGATVRSIPAPPGIDGLAFFRRTVGLFLYALNGGGEGDTIYELDPRNGAVLNSFAILSPTRGGLGGDGAASNRLFVGDWITNEIHEINPITGTIINTFDVGFLGISPAGVAFDGTDLFLSNLDDERIFVIDPNTGSLRRFFTSQAGPLDALAAGGAAAAPPPTTTTTALPPTTTTIIPTTGQQNLARIPGVTIKVSSSWGGWPPERAIDGDLNTSWFSASGDTTTQGKQPFFELIFPSDVTVNRINISGNREFSEGWDIITARLDIFNAAGNVIFSQILNFPPPARDFALSLPNLAGVRRVRLTVTQNEPTNPGTGFSELEVLGTLPGPGTTTIPPATTTAPPTTTTIPPATTTTVPPLPGALTITAIILEASNDLGTVNPTGERWDTIPNGTWQLGVVGAAGTLLNRPDTSITIVGAENKTFSLFASESSGFPFGKFFKVTVFFSNGRVINVVNSIGAPPKPNLGVTFSWVGVTNKDVVQPGETLGKDGKADGEFTLSIASFLPEPTNGLRGEYFNIGKEMTKLADFLTRVQFEGLTPSITRVDGEINFPGGFLGIPFTDFFGVIWTGNINIPVPGEYTFILSSDDGSKLFIDDMTKPVVVHDGLHGFSDKQGTINLTAGLHPIRIEFFENGGGEAIVLGFIPPGGTRIVVPSRMLTPGRAAPSATTVPPTTTTAPPTTTTTAPAAQVKATIQPDTINVGETAQILAISSIPTDVLSFTSDNPRVATVDPKGVVKGVGPGTATITIKGTSGATATVKVTVLSAGIATTIPPTTTTTTPGGFPFPPTTTIPEEQIIIPVVPPPPPAIAPTIVQAGFEFTRLTLSAASGGKIAFGVTVIADEEEMQKGLRIEVFYTTTGIFGEPIPTSLGVLKKIQKNLYEMEISGIAPGAVPVGEIPLPGLNIEARDSKGRRDKWPIVVIGGEGTGLPSGSVVVPKIDLTKAKSTVPVIFQAGFGLSHLLLSPASGGIFTLQATVFGGQGVLNVQAFFETVDVFGKKVPSKLGDLRDEDGDGVYEMKVPVPPGILKIGEVPIPGLRVTATDGIAQTDAWPNLVVWR